MICVEDRGIGSIVNGMCAERRSNGDTVTVTDTTGEEVTYRYSSLICAAHISES